MSIVHSNADRGPAGSPAMCPIGSTRRARTGSREQTANSHMPSPGTEWCDRRLLIVIVLYSTDSMQ